MANKNLESTVLSIEVQKSIDNEGNPVFTKKKIGNLQPNVAVEKIKAVSEGVAGLLKENTRFFYITEVSQISE